jgi:hypothetical protein
MKTKTSKTSKTTTKTTKQTEVIVVRPGDSFTFLPANERSWARLFLQGGDNGNAKAKGE